MKQNTRRDRLCVFLAMLLLQVIHQYFFGNVSNTDEGMLVYHGTAALADFYLIYVASEFLSDELGFQIQCLNLASMLTNAFGWFAYANYVSHWFYDITMMGVSGVIVYKLLWIPNYDAHRLGCFMVRNYDSISHQLHSREAS